MRVTVWRSVPTVMATRARAGVGSLWLGTALFQTFAALPPSGPAGADPARVARDVFQDPDFWWKRLESRPASKSWLESSLTATWDLFVHMLRAIGEWIIKLLHSLFGVFTSDLSGGAVVVWLIVAVLLGWSIWKLYPAIVRWLIGTAQWLSGSARVPDTPAGVTWQALAEASDLFEQAGQAFRNGRDAEAIRLALLALIAQLEKQGLLRYDTTRTNREYQWELRHRSELAAGFGRLARIYERVWYGRAPADRAEAEQAISLCGSLINRESP